MVAGPVLLIVPVVLLVRWLGDSRDSPSVHLRTPREILDERFAKGEIEREEYEARRKALAAQPHSSALPANLRDAVVIRRGHRLADVA
jgi:putative membrane protein